MAKMRLEDRKNIPKQKRFKYFIYAFALIMY